MQTSAVIALALASSVVMASNKTTNSTGNTTATATASAPATTNGAAILTNGGLLGAALVGDFYMKSLMFN
ncbi:uncharacterized protein SAPINGB_P003465 [Magnusiomyces paraingens]|uniref:Uncharacterized protein n=1 Tax=Magnusiomyces paraingens TaxID=2606893 RepID=A0A5E8BPH1_9ASCO|nr:uncharacterized protein SAPINGB_P003465 [Saprochaete ingens]VVT53223.1 unnamed protein product [Saprochaete ingens]